MRWLAIGGAVVLAVVAGAFWALSSSGSPGGVEAPVVAPAVVAAGTAPSPPHGALVLARGHGSLAVGLAAQHAGAGVRLTATVITAEGMGLRGLQVIFTAGATRLPPATPCGAGCYSATADAGGGARRVTVAVSGPGRPRFTLAYALPARWPVSAARLLRRADAVFHGLKSVSYLEHLSSGPGASVTTRWRDEAPDRLSYRTTSGEAGVVIGARRWDLVVGGGWQRGLQNPPLVMPATPWGGGAYDVSLLGSGRLHGRAVIRFSMYEPSTPAWYTVTLERATMRTLDVRMTATAHFMHQSFGMFDAPAQIRPPVAG